MRIEHPAPHHMPQLRKLWQEAFGDTDACLDSFYRTAYAPDRCLCILEKDGVAAVLYWMDCTLDGQKLAYLYAVATRRDCRGRGLCRALMEYTHGLLRSRGYAGTVLVPQQESLRRMYAAMGYRNAGGQAEFACAAAAPVPLRTVGPQEFAELRRTLLPDGAVVQEGEGLAFLAEQMQFYAGADFLLAAYAENGKLFCPEFLGPREKAPGILAALDCREGRFRTPGKEPFAMFRPLTGDTKQPEYFGFAFD